MEVKDTKATVLIGRDANGAEINVNYSELETRMSNLESNFDLLGKKIINIEKQNKVNKIWLIFSVIFMVTLFVCFLVFKFNYPKEIETALSVLIIAFIGALATIVVVRNDSQVKNLENEFNHKINKYEQITSKLNSEFNNTESKLKQLFLELKSKINKQEIIENANSATTNAMMYYRNKDYKTAIGWYIIASYNYDRYGNKEEIISQMLDQIIEIINQNTEYVEKNDIDVYIQLLNDVNNIKAKEVVRLLDDIKGYF